MDIKILNKKIIDQNQSWCVHGVFNIYRVCLAFVLIGLYEFQDNFQWLIIIERELYFVTTIIYRTYALTGIC